MPARFVIHDRLEGPLAEVLDTLGKAIAVKSAKRRRREAGLARRPSELPYLRNPAEIEAAKQLAAHITAERDLPEPAPLEPYMSGEDLLTERLKEVVFTDLTGATQLSLFPA